MGRRLIKMSCCYRLKKWAEVSMLIQRSKNLDSMEKRGDLAEFWNKYMVPGGLYRDLMRDSPNPTPAPATDSGLDLLFPDRNLPFLSPISPSAPATGLGPAKGPAPVPAPAKGPVPVPAPAPDFGSRLNESQKYRLNRYNRALTQGVMSEYGYTPEQAETYLRGRNHWLDPAVFSSLNAKQQQRFRDIANGKRTVRDIVWKKPSQQLPSYMDRQRLNNYNKALRMGIASRDLGDTGDWRNGKIDKYLLSRGRYYDPEYVAPSTDTRYWRIANGSRSVPEFSENSPVYP